MNETLSRIAANLFDKSRKSEDLSSEIHRLRHEIKKMIESEETIFGKFQGLVESFREIIPEERQRYNAAIQALSTTSKLSRQEIVKSIVNQLEELKILEKGLIPALPGGRDELKAMEARSQKARSEISRLREQIARLESEEKEILNGIAAREKEMTAAEKAMREAFADIVAEITLVKKKVEEFTAEGASAQLTPPGDLLKSAVPDEHKSGAGQTIEISEPSAPQYTEWQKKCPMCGGRMDFLSNDRMWMCYSCAHEELEGDKVQGKIEKKSEPVNAPKPVPPGDFFKSAMPAGQKIEISEPSAPQDTQWQKKCPMCGGRMDFLGNDKMWMCYSCAYEEPEGDNVQGKIEKKSEPANAPEPAPASESLFDFSPSPAVPPASDEDRKAKKETSPSRQPVKKKTCPVCHKKMQLYESEKTWRCPYCEYERRI